LFLLKENAMVQAFFETHEADAYVLKHDKQLTKQAHHTRHLRHLPDYLKQGTLGTASSAGVHPKRALKKRLRPEDDPLKVSTLPLA
jgi:hypothetical protein